jgi:hypothetical protein
VIKHKCEVFCQKTNQGSEVGGTKERALEVGEQEVSGIIRGLLALTRACL